MLKESTRDVFKWRKATALRVARLLLGNTFPLHDLDMKGSKVRQEVAGGLRSELRYARRHWPRPTTIKV